MATRPIKDLHTEFNTNFTFGNVSGLSAKPSIRIVGDADATDLSNGEIVLSRQSSASPINFGSKRHELYFIDGWIYINGKTSDVTISEMMDELTRLMNINNDSSGKTYDWQFEQTDYNANYQEGQMTWIISAKELYPTAIA
ncbi:hypothetical protein LCGC14_1257420 [marine sediment metagenome]|uniref:Uncharacterized protein n=1 Tax=marine sediment metagenome TaxID=412755 RepID=A0A0F9L1K5_9ZZZZ